MKEEKTYKIWYWRYDSKRGMYDQGFRTKEYKRRGQAERVAHDLFNNTKYSWVVSATNPFVKKCGVCGKEYRITDPYIITSRYNLTICTGKESYIEQHLDLCTDCAHKIMDAVCKVIDEVCHDQT